MIGLIYVLPAAGGAAMLLACLHLLPLDTALRVARQVIYMYICIQFLRLCRLFVKAGRRKRKARSKRRKRR